MSVAADVWRTWSRGPRAALRDQLARGPHESRALALLMLGCGLVWLAQWPRLRREALLADGAGPDFAQLVGTALFGWLMVLPLAFYLLAALAFAVGRALGGRSPAWAVRLALFWAWLAASPVALLSGVAFGLTGPSVLTNLLAVAWLGAFAAFWAAGQSEAGAVHAG